MDWSQRALLACEHRGVDPVGCKCRLKTGRKFLTTRAVLLHRELRTNPLVSLTSSRCSAVSGALSSMQRYRMWYLQS